MLFKLVKKTDIYFLFYIIDEDLTKFLMNEFIILYLKKWIIKRRLVQLTIKMKRQLKINSGFKIASTRLSSQ